MNKETKRTGGFQKSAAGMADRLVRLAMKEATDAMPKWRHGTPPHKGWWLTRTTHRDGHVSIACETFQDDKWPYEGDDSVLYMDMNELEAMQEAEGLKDSEKKAAEEEGYTRGYTQAKEYYFDTFKDVRFEELLARKIKEWQESGDDPDMMKDELELDAKLLKAVVVRSEKPSYEEIRRASNSIYLECLHRRFFMLYEFAEKLVDWCLNINEEETDKTEG